MSNDKPGDEPDVGGLGRLTSASKATFEGLAAVTAACHGLLNAPLIPPSPKPDWFDDLNSKLDAAKAQAQAWIDNIAPGVTGEVLVLVINHGTTFSAISSQVSSIAADHPDARGAGDPFVEVGLELTGPLDQSLHVTVAGLETRLATINAWGETMHARDAALREAADQSPDAKAAAALALSAAEQVLGSTGDALTRLRELIGAWGELRDAMRDALAELRAGKVTLGTFAANTFGAATQAEWAAATQFAQKLATASMGIPGRAA
ncbi:hypothetical protein [Bradyrhizobium septentrionale]|uniref:Uncharacterized protein n=1 Tax=Bradyrhizobium septentrionale TaxID=1404411 RepID=A0A974A2M6_9BRAD|nr:hypothetical protein [Bradyrhizobium septentrionale]UGY14908.1 hypothetical protein HAP48_0041300 [Bradyrhizobium septentrionale]UGY23480.1 hypothetical protein HU675_0036880 [Bradyrhizobium septentrionale]